MNMSEVDKKSGRTGRPRGFDSEAALEAAMRVFWEKGYEGATLADLTMAMGINRASMYAAFGDKESLYKKSLARYMAGPMSYLREALQKPTFRGVVEHALLGSAKFLSTPGNPKGCMTVQGALAVGTDAAQIKQLMIGGRKQGEVAVKMRIEQAKKEGELDSSVNSADLARYLTLLVNGMAIQAANGSNGSELRRTAKLALQFLGYSSDSD